jgi:hypothetical protein
MAIYFMYDVKQCVLDEWRLIGAVSRRRSR